MAETTDLLKEEVNRALEVLKQGGVILYPTDTIWGIGCDATNRNAVDRVYKIKQRDDSKALIVLLDEEGKLQRYVRHVPEIAWNLIEVTNKPLTIVYSDVLNLAPNLMASDGSAAIRIVRHPFCQELIRRFNRPIVSTSANISGQAFSGAFTDISNEIKTQVDYIVNLHRDSPSGPPSSVIKLEDGGRFNILRP
ncbi:MAG: hypothetical protein RL220_101 [Bacteroidota bacterium]